MRRLDRGARIGVRDIIGFSCVRNELLRLPYCLEYHRSLGIDRFVVVDNGSTDGTLSYLLAQSDVLVYHTNESYSASRCGIKWVNALLCELGADHWIVTLDADEMLVYPGYERLGLRELIGFLEDSKAQAMRTLLVDMYSKEPIRETTYSQGEPFTKLCQYFDKDSYFNHDSAGMPTRGGPRYRLFWEGRKCRSNPPFLINVPLVKWRKDLQYATGTHLLSGVTLSPLVGAKLHFKFLSDFYHNAREEARRKEHWDNAAQYQSYWEVLSKDPDLSAIYDGSVRYSGSSQLLELGLMKAPNEYSEYVGSRER